MNNEEILGRYFTFPISLMTGVLENPKQRLSFLNDILYSHLYWHSLKLADADDVDIENETELYRFKRSGDYYNVDIGGNDKQIIAKMERAKQILKTGKGKPLTSITETMFWDFYNSASGGSPQKKKENWEILFVMLAAKSIIGTAEFKLTNNKLLFARMNGKNKSNDNSNLKDYTLTRTIRNRYLTKEIQKLGLVYYAVPGLRGFYIGFSSRISAREIMAYHLDSLNRNRKKREKKDIETGFPF